jgi:hypothetical protein
MHQTPQLVSLNHHPPLAPETMAKAMCNVPTLAELMEQGCTFSSHSIRVGATVMLRIADAEDSFMQTRLRWKSSTFLTCLRNMPRLARTRLQLLQHMDTDSWDLPQKNNTPPFPFLFFFLFFVPAPLTATAAAAAVRFIECTTITFDTNNLSGMSTQN